MKKNILKAAIILFIIVLFIACDFTPQSQYYSSTPTSREALINDINEKIVDSNGRYHVDLSEINVSNITDMCNLFSPNMSSVNEEIQELEAISQSDRTDIQQDRLDKLNSLSKSHSINENRIFDISKWDTSNVTDMSYMFNNLESSISDFGDNFDTSKVTNMKGMFSGASEFNHSLGDKFDTSNVTDMSSMFCG